MRFTRPRLHHAEPERIKKAAYHAAFFTDEGERVGLALQSHGNAHAAADAQRGQTLLGVTALHFVQQRHQDAAARRSDRVANGDGATIDVDLGGVNAQLLVDGASLGCKGFIELVQIDIGSRPASALQSFACG